MLYSHWGGYELPQALAKVLPLAEGRYGDHSYASRIIIHNLLNEIADPASETGAGISVGELTDNEYPVIVVNVPDLTIGAVTEAKFVKGERVPGETIPFAGATAEAIEALRGSPS